MKYIVCFFGFIIPTMGVAQSFYLKIEGNTLLETKTIDSIAYVAKHNSVAALVLENEKMEDLLQKKGFLGVKKMYEKKVNDSVFEIKYLLQKKINFIHIYIGSNLEWKKVTQHTSDTIRIPFLEFASFMNETLEDMQQKGFPLSQIYITNKKIVGQTLYADLVVELDKKRSLNDLVILGFDDFPKNAKKALERKMKNKTITKESMATMYDDFNSIPYLSQTKYPEILFTTEKTKVYVYVEKNKPNTFDGFIGFSTNEKNKVEFNGYLNLQLINALKAAEKLELNWKNNGKEQTNFSVSAALPYLFNSDLHIKTKLHIIKQDSTFQNTNFNADLGYPITKKSSLFVGYQNTTSASIVATDNPSFKTNFGTVSFIYSKKDFSNLLFPNPSYFNLNMGFGSRKIKTETTNQYFTQINAAHTLNLNAKNAIFVHHQLNYLKSTTYNLPELYRFGGIENIRGFAENTLQANFWTGVFIEYRNILAKNLYFHTITDYAFLEDKTSATTQNLYSFGFGFGLFTKNGLLNLVYANGTTENQAIKLSNALIHLRIQTRF